MYNEKFKLISIEFLAEFEYMENLDKQTKFLNKICNKKRKNKTKTKRRKRNV